MMIAASDFGIAQPVFAQRRAAELAGPDHECRIEQAALLQVLNQGRHRLIGHAAVVGQFGFRFE